VTEPLVARLTNVTVEHAQGAILRGLEVDVPETGVTVILGPAGTGKSTLLRVLAGQTDDGIQVSGDVDRRRQPACLIRQARSRDGDATVGLDALAETLRSTDAPLILLDEPDRRVRPDEIDALAELLDDEGTRRAVVVVTHHLAFARRIASETHLLCAGSIVASAKGDALFRDPPNELAAHFVRHGNCWPASTVELPTHFRWLRAGELAGMGKPGLLRDIDDDLASIALAGISLVVTLTEEPPPAARLRSFGLASRHFPIRDMDVPALGAATALARDIVRAIKSGERVAVHCHAGLGRTGTVLAAVLVFEGMSAEEAILRVREVEPKSIQNRAQETFVTRFAESLRGE